MALGREERRGTAEETKRRYDDAKDPTRRRAGQVAAAGRFQQVLSDPGQHALCGGVHVHQSAPRELAEGVQQLEETAESNR